MLLRLIWKIRSPQTWSAAKCAPHSQRKIAPICQHSSKLLRSGQLRVTYDTMLSLKCLQSWAWPKVHVRWNFRLLKLLRAWFLSDMLEQIGISFLQALICHFFFFFIQGHIRLLFIYFFFSSSNVLVTSILH